MNESRLNQPDAEPGHLGRYWKDPDWQRIWLATQQMPWRSLAILPAEPGLSTWKVAQALLDVGWQHRGKPIVVADLRSLTLTLVEPLIREVQGHVGAGELVLIALPCLEATPVAAHVARAADRSILCVRLGSSPMSAADETVDAIGRERFIGTIALRPMPSRGRKPAPRRELPLKSRE